MAPVDLSAFPTFVGTLQMFQLTGIDGLSGQYFCGIRLLTPIEGPSYIYYSLFLLDYRIERLVRFDHPMLESCVVGDTIYVTGEPKVISGGVALGVTMRYVQPKQYSKDEELYTHTLTALQLDIRLPFDG